jgi:hypothetical protein
LISIEQQREREKRRNMSGFAEVLVFASGLETGKYEKVKQCQALLAEALVGTRDSRGISLND